MQRELFSIRPAADGWLVVGEPGKPVNQATPRKALDRALRLARERHKSTGRPTGVKVRLSCGDVVLVDFYG